MLMLGRVPLLLLTLIWGETVVLLLFPILRPACTQRSDILPTLDRMKFIAGLLLFPNTSYSELRSVRIPACAHSITAQSMIILIAACQYSLNHPSFKEQYRPDMVVPSLCEGVVCGAMAEQSGFCQDEGDKSPLFGWGRSIWSRWYHLPHKRHNRGLTASGPAETARETDVKSK